MKGSSITTAFVICPPDSMIELSIAGLTVGQRLLLSLYYGGIKKVAYLGSGKRPLCYRAQLQEVTPEQVHGERVLVVTADLVFDRNLVKTESFCEGFPLQIVKASDSASLIEDPTDFIAKNTKECLVPEGEYAIRVKSKESARTAYKILLKSLVKPADGFISRHINRKISVSISSLLVRLPIRPNHLTIFIMLLGILSGVAAYYSSNWIALVLAGFLFQAQSVLDGCDGEIARLKYLFSVKGQWLDSIGDDITNYSFCLGLALGYSNNQGWEWLFWFGFLVLVVQIYASLIMYQRIYKMGTGDLLAIPNLVTSNKPKGLGGKVVQVIHIMTKRDFFVFITSLITIMGFPMASFFLISLGSFIMAPSLTLNEMRIRKAEKQGIL